MHRQETVPELAKSTDSLAPAQAATRQSSLLGHLIHDLNNLLGIIMGNSELLMEQTALDEKSARRAQHIYQAAIQARDTIVTAQHAIARTTDDQKDYCR